MFTNPLTTSLFLLLATSLSQLTHATPLSSMTLAKREDKVVGGGGTITGGIHDSLNTYGLATCPGMAAVGVAACSGCIAKVLTHVLCGLEWERYLSEFVAAYQEADLGFSSIALAVANPDITAAPDAQRIINMGCFRAAANLYPVNERWRILHLERQTLEGEGGTLKVTVGNAIIAEGTVTMNPEPPRPAACSWPYRYLSRGATDGEITRAVQEAHQICSDYFDGNGIPCRAPLVPGCDFQAKYEGECKCFEVAPNP
ncbi:hypothetical protein V8F20_012392 [Naviculisporaceae sp. PSN 640]